MVAAVCLTLFGSKSIWSQNQEFPLGDLVRGTKPTDRIYKDDGNILWQTLTHEKEVLVLRKNTRLGQRSLENISLYNWKDT